MVLVAHRRAVDGCAGSDAKWARKHGTDEVAAAAVRGVGGVVRVVVRNGVT
jgi:hypothetical protein